MAQMPLNQLRNLANEKYKLAMSAEDPFQAEKPRPATKKALQIVLAEGMKQYKNTLKALAKR